MSRSAVVRPHVRRAKGFVAGAACVLLVAVSLGAADSAWAISPATGTTPLRQQSAPGAYDGLSVEQRQAITDNVLRARGIAAQPYRVENGTAANYYAEKVSEAVWDAEARVSKINYGATNFSSQQLRLASLRVSFRVWRRRAPRSSHTPFPA
jgi:hypothetical protein